MASSDARDADLALLSGSELVKHLRTTCRLADYEAAVRVLDARDRRLAKAEAALARVKEDLHARDGRLAKVEAALAKAALAIREKYGALKDAPRGPVNEDARGGPRSEVRRRPRDEASLPDDAIAAPAPAPHGERHAEVAGEKGPVVIDLCCSDEEEEREGCRPGASGVFRKRKATASEVSEEGRRVRVSCKRNAAASACSSDDEDDTLTLSQLMKKKRDGAQPGADGEPKNADFVRPMGDYLPEASLVIKEVIEATVGGWDEPNVANFVQGRGNVESGEDGGMSRAMPSPLPLGSAVGNSSEKNPSRVNSTGPLGIDLPGISLVIRKEAIEATVGGSDEPKVANFVQGRGNVESRGDGGMSREMPSPKPFDSAVGNSSEKNFSMANHVGVRTAWKKGSLGNDLLKTPVITECPEIRVVGSELNVASFVNGRGNGKSADNGVSRAPPQGFAARTGSPPLGFAARTGSQKNLSKADHGGPRIAGKDDSFADQEEDSLIQVRNLSLSAKKIVESALVGAVSPKGHTGSALSGNMVSGLEAIREQEKTNGLGHKGNVMPVTNGIGKQHGKLRSSRSREISDGGHLRTSDKQLGSATLPPHNELHSGQISVERSLPLAVTRNWKYETDVLTSCIENKELCMQAACALYRQKMFQSTEGGRSGSSELCKSDAHRVAKLVEYLLDGDVQGPLKRTAEELVKHDPTGPSFLEKVVCQFFEQLFYIYKNKEDPYFC